jgi:glycosyltransferase involved in cell wall biosynthesis
MHIGINAQLLSYGQNYRNGGVSRYIRFLLAGLTQQASEHSYTIFVNGDEVSSHFTPQPHIHFVSAPWPESKPTTRVLWEQFTLPTLIRQLHIDVLHSPVNVLPMRMPGSCASVVTLHDLAFLRFPEVLTTPKRLYHRTFTLPSLRQANLIIAVSDSTKQDAHELVDIPLSHIQTVYTCIDEKFSREDDDRNIQTFRTKKGLDEGYILYLGTLEPRKNIPALLTAYQRLRQQHHRTEKLVLAGGKGWLYDEIFAQVQQLGLENNVLFPGFVPDEEQVRWYQAASVFAYPSLYEGFGIPVAEALVCGTPTVTSTASSLPEAAADIALCVQPDDITALTDALYRALTDQTYRAYCRGMATSVAQRFSTQAMVNGTIAAYERAASLYQQQRMMVV